MTIILTNNFSQLGGDLFKKKPSLTPFLSSIGLTNSGEGKFLNGFADPESIQNVKGGGLEICWNTYDRRDPTIPADKEFQTAKSPDFTNKVQKSNTVQIFDSYTFGISDYAQATAGQQRVAGAVPTVNTGVLTDKQLDILAEQTEYKMENLKDDLEKTILLGTEVKPTDPSNTAPQMQGVFGYVDAGNKVDVSGTLLENHLTTAVIALADNFAFAENEDGIMNLMCSPSVRDKLFKMYAVPERTSQKAGSYFETLVIAGYEFRIISNPFLKIYSKEGSILMYPSDMIKPVALMSQDIKGNWGQLVIQNVSTDKSGKLFRLFAHLSVQLGHPQRLALLENITI